MCVCEELVRQKYKVNQTQTKEEGEKVEFENGEKEDERRMYRGEREEVCGLGWKG